MRHADWTSCARCITTLLLLSPLIPAQSRYSSDTLPFPRIGNIWTGTALFATKPAHANRSGLYLGPGPTPLPPEDAKAIRAANPNVLILTDISATDTSGAGSPPDSYYLRDVNGNRLEDWCGGSPRYILNLTQPADAQFLAVFVSLFFFLFGVVFFGSFFVCFVL